MRDRMQQAFTCPVCGSQNAIGQQFCGTCGAALFGGTQYYEWPPMHILALDQRSKLILGFRFRGGSAIVLPAITTDGKLSMVPAGNDEAVFRKLQTRVRDFIKSEYGDCLTHTCSWLSMMVEQTPQHKEYRVFYVWNVSGSLQKVPEMDWVYESLAKLKVQHDTYWNQVEQFLSREPQKSWINNLITHLKVQHNWAEYVARRLSQPGMDYQGQWTDEVWVSGKLERL